MPIKLAASMPPTTVVPMIWRATIPRRAPSTEACNRRLKANSRQSGSDATQSRPFQRRVDQRFPFFVLVLGELDDMRMRSWRPAPISMIIAHLGIEVILRSR